VFGDVPETDGPVYSAAGEQAAVGMKGYVNGALFVSLGAVKREGFNCY